MRISAGARRRAKNRGWIHVHSDVTALPTYFPPARTTPSVRAAPIEVRDAIYRELIRISPATRYRPQLIYHPQGLASRGLLIEDTLNTEHCRRRVVNGLAWPERCTRLPKPGSLTMPIS
jgi:hypothetical protein